MNLWLRLLLLRLSLRRRSSVDLLDEIALDLRVWPTDLDLLGHVNNGRFLSLMDLGRVALMARIGLLDVARQQQWTPLVRNIDINYYKPLFLGQRYRLHTRVLGWDEKWLYVGQRFDRGETLIAEARVRGLLRGREGNIPTARVLHMLDQPGRVSPPLPPTRTD